MKITHAQLQALRYHFVVFARKLWELVCRRPGWTMIIVFCAFYIRVEIKGDIPAVYMIRTSGHSKCRFPDGSYTEGISHDKWYFYAEVFPHATTRRPLDSSSWYAESWWGRKHPWISGAGSGPCTGMGKLKGRLFFYRGFQNHKGQVVHLESERNDKAVISPDWTLLPKGIGHRLGPSYDEIADGKHLYATAAALLPLEDDDHLLFEQPLIAHRYPSVPSGTVLYVYQSFSNDYGKTWSTSVVTKDAKLHEIGKTLEDQSWAAKPVPIFASNRFN